MEQIVDFMKIALFGCQKSLQIVKIFVLFIILCTFSLSAEIVYSQQTEISMNLQNATIQEAFKQIERTTDFMFLATDESENELHRRINVSIENESMNEIMDLLLKNTNLNYQIIGKQVLVFLGERAPVNNVITFQHQPPSTFIVRGRVTDSDNLPVPGVAVIVEGTTKGIDTDKNGNYEIQTKPDDRLQFICIGLKSKIVNVNGREVINVILEYDNTALEEMVVTGYQTIERRDMVGAYTTLKIEDVMIPTYSSIDQMLQGQVPGMIVSNTSGRVGSTPNITIRGQSTILGNSAPLWVVDGIIQPDPIPINANMAVVGNMQEMVGSQISWLNPNDIETITVLKDASATAVYGSRASNGVIVITTKKGRADRTSIQYSANFSVRARPTYDMFNFMNSFERIQFSKEAYDAGARYQSVPLPQIYTYEGLIQMLNSGKISENDLMAQMQKLEVENTDWLDILTRNSFSHNHNVSLAGSTEKTSYNASIGYSSNKGIEINNDIENYSARLNISTNLTDKIRLNFNISGSLSETLGYGPDVSPINYARSTSRAIPAFDEGERVFYQTYGGYMLNSSEVMFSYNILNELENSFSKFSNSRTSLSLNLDWTISPNLTYQIVGGLSHGITNSEGYAGEKTTYIARNYRGYDYGSELSGSTRFKAAMLPFGGELLTRSSKSASYNMQHKLVFSKTFDEIHRVNAMAGLEVRSEDSESEHNTVWGFAPERGERLIRPTPVADLVPIGRVVPQDWGILERIYQGGFIKSTQTNNYISYFGTLAYSLNNRYVMNFNIRGDASNRFGQNVNKQFDPIYSLGASWRMAEEHFVKENISWLNQFNLRATYGIQGYVVQSLSPDMILSLQGVRPIYNEYFNHISSLPNPHLKWEHTKSWNLGLDIQVFKDVTMSINYYKRHSNAINLVDVAQEYGLERMYMNGGLIDNKGVEVSVSLTPYNGRDFAWTLRMNSSKNWNLSKTEDAKARADQLTKYDFLHGRSDMLLKKGYPLNAFWSYSSAGLSPENGMPIFNLLNQEVDNNIDPTKFLVYSGEQTPYFTGGFHNTLRYKSIMLNLNFSAILGSKKRLPNPYATFYSGKIPDPFDNLSKDLNNRWKKPGDEANTIIPALYTSVDNIINTDLPDGTRASIYDMWASSDAMVVDASFLRLQQLSLSWSMPTEWSSKFGATSFRASFNVNNLFVIANKRFQGFDPELGNSVMPRIYSFGFNVGF